MVQISLSGKDWTQIVRSSLISVVIVIVLTLALDYPNLRRMDEEMFWGNFRNDFLIPIAVGFPAFLLLFWKIRQLACAKRILEELAYTDSLTGALNRRAFQDRVENILRGASRRPVAMCVIDLDHFKTINDTHGHEVGDEALKAVSSAIARCLSDDEIFGRIGGEEFVLFTPNVTEPLALLGAERIRTAIEACDFSRDRLGGRLTASIGVALAYRTPRFQDLYREADACLYKAKTGGRNRVVMTVLSRRAEEYSSKLTADGAGAAA